LLASWSLSPFLFVGSVTKPTLQLSAEQCCHREVA